jgi:hypothetical protein
MSVGSKYPISSHIRIIGLDRPSSLCCTLAKEPTNSINLCPGGGLTGSKLILLSPKRYLNVWAYERNQDPYSPPLSGTRALCHGETKDVKKRSLILPASAPSQSGNRPKPLNGKRFQGFGIFLTYLCRRRGRHPITMAIRKFPSLLFHSKHHCS